MILIRETFIAKPGMASKLAKMFKDMSADWGGKARVMTDLIGKYNTVIMEGEYESLAAWETEMKEMMDKEPKDQPKEQSGPKHTDMYTHGKREVFRIW